MCATIVSFCTALLDCYVAACGLPDPRKDHAVVMARFARDCLLKTNELTRRLERTLGPDTGDVRIICCQTIVPAIYFLYDNSR